jgi:hypothetical protein
MIVKYKTKYKGEIDYNNRGETKCNIFSAVFVASGYCCFYCKNFIKHDRNKKEIKCKNNNIEQTWTFNKSFGNDR